MKIESSTQSKQNYKYILITLPFSLFLLLNQFNQLTSHSSNLQKTTHSFSLLNCILQDKVISLLHICAIEKQAYIFGRLEEIQAFHMQPCKINCTDVTLYQNYDYIFCLLFFLYLATNKFILESLNIITIIHEVFLSNHIF